MIPKIVPHLLTYPRSGMHFFDDTLWEEEGIHFTKSHYLDELFDKNNNKRRKIITIARDPIDSLASYLSLYHEDNWKSGGHEFIIKEKITEYVLMYSFLCENANYVIDFNDLIQHPESVIRKILGLLDIDKNTYMRFSRVVIEKHKDYIPSSRSSEKYDRSTLDIYDLDLCYYFYHKLFNKRITI